MNKNPFFNIAIDRASRILGKKAKFIPLITKLTLKMKEVRWQEIKRADVKEKVYVVGRLLKAYATGSYREIPWKPLLLITAATIYFINPIDLIPDLLPVLGLTDDIGILISVYASVNAEIDKFLTWEKSQVKEI